MYAPLRSNSVRLARSTCRLLALLFAMAALFACGDTLVHSTGEEEGASDSTQETDTDSEGDSEVDELSATQAHTDGSHEDCDHDDTDGSGGDVDPDDNMLVNFDFEAGEQADGCPADWNCRSYPDGDAGIFSVDDQVAYDGAAAHWRAEASQADGDPVSVISQDHPSDPGRTYEVSTHYRSDDLDTAPLVHILFYDANDQLLDDQAFGGEADTRGFERISGETMEAPSGTAMVRFNLSTVESVGKIWWDEAALVDVSPDDIDDRDDDNDGGGSGNMPAGAVDLCDRGLSNGDLINPHIENNISNGATLVVCKGTYRLDDLRLSGNDWTVIAPDGATLKISGTTRLFTSGNNYRFAGFVFDQTSSGFLMMLPSGDDWVVDHIAWKGEHPGGGRLMAPSVDSNNGTGLVERMYMGDGQAEGTESGAIWVNANAGHYGDLTFRRSNVSHFIDNGIYGTGPGTKGQPGCTHIEDSYLHSNTIANARTGSPQRTCRVQGNVFVLDDTTQECGVGCSSPGARTTRGVWAWHGRVDVRDNDFTVTHGQRLAESKGGSIVENNNRTGADASTSPPGGVPTSADDILANPPGWNAPTP